MKRVLLCLLGVFAITSCSKNDKSFVIDSEFGPIEIMTYSELLEEGLGLESYLVNASPREQVGFAYALIHERFPDYDLSSLKLWAVSSDSQQKIIEERGTVYDVSVVIDLRDTDSMEKVQETKGTIVYHYPSFRVEFHLDWNKYSSDRRLYVKKSYGIYREKVKPKDVENSSDVESAEVRKSETPKSTKTE